MRPGHRLTVSIAVARKIFRTLPSAAACLRKTLRTLPLRRQAATARSRYKPSRNLKQVLCARRPAVLRPVLFGRVARWPITCRLHRQNTSNWPDRKTGMDNALPPTGYTSGVDSGLASQHLSPPLEYWLCWNGAQIATYGPTLRRRPRTHWIPTGSTSGIDSTRHGVGSTFSPCLQMAFVLPRRKTAEQSHRRRWLPPELAV